MNAIIKQAPLTITLTIAGVLGNYLHLPLLFGVDFIFGSIAVLLAIRLIGFKGALFVAIASGAYTFIIWGHPYALIIFTLEAMIVSWLLKQKTDSIILADLGFWIVVGMPLVWFFYAGLMQMSQNQTLLILFKQPVNGISNALIATFLLFLITKGLSLRSSYQRSNKIHLRELIFSTIVAVSLTSTLLLFSYENKQNHNNYESTLKNQLEIYGDFLEHHIKDNNLTSISASELKNDYHLTKRSTSIIILDKNNNIISSSLPEELQNSFINSGKRSTKDNQLSIWMPKRDNLPLMLWWKKAYYYLELPLPTSRSEKLILLQSSQIIINKLQSDAAQTFSALFLLIIISALISYLISNLLSKTIIELSNSTKNIAEKLKNNVEIEWPESSISELSRLTSQTKLMSDNIAETFNDVNIQSTTIIESSIDAIITINSNGHIKNVNSACEKIFAYHRNELIDKEFCKLISSENQDRFKSICQSFHTGNSFENNQSRQESIGVRKHGELFPIEFSISLIPLKNKNLFACVISDISQRKANEKLKNEFISTVSHELRTPLTSIKGALSLIQARKEVATKEEIDNMLSLSVRNVSRLSEIINDLLDFEKLDSEGIQYNIQLVNVVDCLSRLIEESSPMAEQAGITISLAINESLYIKVDSFRFSQVIRNFISNSIKFTPEGSCIEVGSIIENNSVKIFVKDTGNGISESFRPYIFQRFAQADGSTTKKIQRGTGLGLAISKRITEDMGGEIGFESIEGKGSTFFIIFPLQKSSE